MNPILVVDDDEDDLMLIREAVDRLHLERPFRFFKSGKALLQHLQDDKEAPFLILCDVNLPGENGFEVKEAITSDNLLKYISVPFIFWSTSASEPDIRKAYDLPAQGFFIKPSNFDELCQTLKLILDYWQKSQHPKLAM